MTENDVFCHSDLILTTNERNEWDEFDRFSYREIAPEGMAEVRKKSTRRDCSKYERGARCPDVQLGVKIFRRFFWICAYSPCIVHCTSQSRQQWGRMWQSLLVKGANEVSCISFCLLEALLSMGFTRNNAILSNFFVELKMRALQSVWKYWMHKSGGSFPHHKPSHAMRRQF